MNKYENQECIELVEKEIEANQDFINLNTQEVESYLLKIDRLSTFEKFYVNGNLAGFVSFYCNNKDSKKAFVTLVLVDKNYRGMNIAYKMLSKVINIVKDNGFIECSLEVKVENRKAIYLYHKLGFNEIYRNGDTIIMSILI